MARVLSGIQPTGEVHLGNYIGAISRWAKEQGPEHFFCIVDLHAITIPQDPSELRSKSLDLATWLLAAGIEPGLLFVQSQVREHSELAWILNCVATMGELHRMTQFKEKSEGHRQSVSVGLFDYPVLQAADILIYHADEVPVGADQQQHVELTRDIAQRFNSRYGETFTLPKATFPTSGARIMDLQQVDKKMSKSSESPGGTIVLAEDEAATHKKILRAVTDSGSEIRAGDDKPGVTNLLDLMSAVTGASLSQLEDHFNGKGYGDFKKEIAEAVNGFLRPVRDRYAELRQDPAAVEESLRKGSDRAREVAAATMAIVRERVGFLT